MVIPFILTFTLPITLLSIHSFIHSFIPLSYFEEKITEKVGEGGRREKD